MKHRRIPGARLKDLSSTKLIPNILTLLGLCAGITAVRFALHGQWEAAVAAIGVAGLLDVLDGGMARLLSAGSEFGAELDSLADLVSFGVAPAMVLYLWSMQDAATLGWALTLLFCVCCALRLARFNTGLEADDAPPWAERYFTGVPAPAGAGLVLLPMVLSFEFPDAAFGHVALNAVVIVAVSVLMVGRAPTYSLKGIRVPSKLVVPVMVLVGLLAGFVVGAPWLTAAAIGLLYILSLPASYVSYRRLVRAAEKTEADQMAPADKTPD